MKLFSLFGDFGVIANRNPAAASRFAKTSKLRKVEWETTAGIIEIILLSKI
ncbi:MAG: hypothetical protein K2H01_00555 [Ruminococcus sp.]|nr:hypothetical protein [Ruminococcus sp.]